MAAFEDRSVSIGRIFARTFGVMRHNPVTVFGLAFLFTFPRLVAGYLFLLERGAQPDGAAFSAGFGAMSGVVGLLLSAILQGALTWATLADSEGSDAGIGACLGAALSRIVAILVVSLLLGIAVVIGLLLFVAPGLIIAAMWCVVVPVLVVERTGIGRAFGRSRALTAGARWRIFALGLVVVGAFSLIALLQVWMGVAASVGGSTAAPIGRTIFQAALGTVTGAFVSILPAALYVELRDWKEGAPSERLGEIFA